MTGIMKVSFCIIKGTISLPKGTIKKTVPNLLVRLVLSFISLRSFLNFCQFLKTTTLYISTVFVKYPIPTLKSFGTPFWSLVVFREFTQNNFGNIIFKIY